MTAADNTAGGKTTGNSEVTFADVVKFLRRNWKFITLLTILLLAVAVAVLLLWPKEYQKNLAFKADLDPTSELLSRVERESLSPQDQIGNQAVISLSSGDFGEVEVQARYSTQAKVVEVALQSRDEDALAGVTSEIVSYLKDELPSTLQEIFDDVLEARVTRFESIVEENREVLARVKRENGNSASQAEAIALVTVASAETNLESAKRTREDLPRLTAEALSIEVVNESDVRLSRIPVALFLLAVAASLMAAVILSLLREVRARGKSLTA